MAALWVKAQFSELLNHGIQSISSGFYYDHSIPFNQVGVEFSLCRSDIFIQFLQDSWWSAMPYCVLSISLLVVGFDWCFLLTEVGSWCCIKQEVFLEVKEKPLSQHSSRKRRCMILVPFLRRILLNDILYANQRCTWTESHCFIKHPHLSTFCSLILVSQYNFPKPLFIVNLRIPHSRNLIIQNKTGWLLS